MSSKSWGLYRGKPFKGDSTVLLFVMLPGNDLYAPGELSRMKIDERSELMADKSWKKMMKKLKQLRRTDEYFLVISSFTAGFRMLA